MSKPDQLSGGWSEEKVADDNVQKIYNEVKPDAEKITGMDFKVFTAKIYREQIVAGINYLIKVHVGGDDYIHLFVFQELPCNGGGVKLIAVQYPKTLPDPLVPF